jgi:hypothetical protein
MSGHAISDDSNLHILSSWLSAEIGPVQKVINIIELCEQILEYLPCADLNRARCICRQFETVISQSTLMRQRSSLRLAPKQSVWATPDDTLLTGIYAEDHIAATKAEGRKMDELWVYELQPYLKVDHLNVQEYRSSHRPMGKRDFGGWLTPPASITSVGPL